MQMDSRLINELSERLSALVPAANELRQEARAKIEQALKTGLSDLDVLTREEFEGQAQALSRAQQRVAELETVVADLESRLTSLEQNDVSS
ncbi:MAG: accessory factor UbiK family protein [Pseudohongiellaceae bacterium]